MIQFNALVQARESGNEKRYDQLWTEALATMENTLQSIKSQQNSTDERIILSTFETCKNKLNEEAKQKYGVIGIELLKVFSKSHGVKLPKLTLPKIEWQNDYYFHNRIKDKTMDITNFESAIKEYLDKYAEKDKEFAEKYNNPKKSISECCQYITKEVEKTLKERKNTCVPVKNDEVYSMAVHYYDEEDLVVEELVSKVEIKTASTPSEPEKPKKTRKPKAKKTEVAEEIDENIPEPLEIPIF